MSREGGGSSEPILKRGKHEEGSSSVPLIETIETEEEEEYILLRFPCFDFFRNVHLCEKQPQPDGEAPPPDESTSSKMAFTAEGINFSSDFPPVRSVRNPLLYLNAGTPSAMVFRGAWEEELPEGECGRTNRVILHLAQHAKREKVDGEEVEEAGPNEKEKESTPSAVSSLFHHLREGVTADEKRQREEQRAKEAGDWTYDKVITPSAILVMSRIS